MSEVTYKSITLQICNVNLSIGESKILQDVSASVKPGVMLAVMGPSGSGKTSLLNFMSGRRPQNSVFSGGIKISGRDLTSKDNKIIGYVTQEDVFFPQLTLRQTLWFYSQVKLESSISSKEKQRRVDEVVDMLELSKCLDTNMGDSSSKGLSGGEKKRANIACELLRRPQILFLDEPTSGLDASLAFKVVEIMGNWCAQANSIVVASIHQPSSQTFQQFSELMLLVDGQVGYFGDVKSMPNYFRNIGVEFCQDWNAADSMLEAVKESSDHKSLIIAKGKSFTQTDSVNSDSVHVNLGYIDSRNSIDQKAQIDESLELDTEANGHSIKENYSDHGNVHVMTGSSWFTQFLALSYRCFIVTKDSILSIHTIAQSLFVAIVASAMWFQLDRVEDNLVEFNAAIFFVSSYMVFAPFFDAIMTFYTDLEIVKHERKASMYRISAYYMAKMIVDIPLLLVMPLITLTPIYWAIGFGDFSVYVAFTAVITLNSLASQGIGVTFSLFTENARTNMTFAFVFMIFSFLTGGFFSTRMPVWFDWSKYLSYIRYCYQFSLWIIMENIGNFSCATTHPSAFSNCTLSNGTASITGLQVLRQHPDSFLPQWVNIVVAFGLFFGFRAVGYVLLRFLRKV